MWCKTGNKEFLMSDIGRDLEISGYNHFTSKEVAADRRSH
jgi:hypothetical protein